jgi:hypothetical protein
MRENERDEDRRIINGGGIDMSYICSPLGEVYPSATYQLGMQQPPLHCVRQVFISIISKMSRSNQSPYKEKTLRSPPMMAVWPTPSPLLVLTTVIGYTTMDPTLGCNGLLLCNVNQYV